MATRSKNGGAKDDAEALAALLARSRVGSSVSGERAIDTDSGAPRGTLIADRYRVIEQIGRGGMSRVYAARDLLLNRDVALKVVSFEVGAREELETRFRREVEMAMQLRGPAFVKVFDHAIRVECAYMAMELLKGESLQSYLSREGRLDCRGALDLLRGLSEALTVAHSLCIVHRDLKPGNIFILDGGGQRIRLIDFGIARDLWTSSTLTKTGAILGSPHYVSPEQALAETVDHRTDLWAIGVILFRCLTGLRPFDGKLSQLVLGIVKDKHPLPSKLAPSLPASVDAFFERALAKKPEHRFQDVREMLAAFEEVVTGWPQVLRHATVTPIRGIAQVARVAPPVDEPEQERTRAAGSAYASFAALVSTERISGYPTIDVPSPLFVPKAPATGVSEAPASTRDLSDHALSPWVSSRPVAGVDQITREPAARLPSRSGQLAVFLLSVSVVLLLWLLTR